MQRADMCLGRTLSPTVGVNQLQRQLLAALSQVSDFAPRGLRPASHRRQHPRSMQPQAQAPFTLSATLPTPSEARGQQKQDSVPCGRQGSQLLLQSRRKVLPGRQRVHKHPTLSDAALRVCLSQLPAKAKGDGQPDGAPTISFPQPTSLAKDSRPGKAL